MTSKFWNYIAIILMYIFCWKVLRLSWLEGYRRLKDEVKPYEANGDCALYSDAPTTFVDLLPGQFMIVYPEDPHAPLIGQGKIRKLIAKVKL